MTDKPSPAARAERMREALRANLRRRKQELSRSGEPGEAATDKVGFERRRDRLSPRIQPAKDGTEPNGN